MCGKSEKRLLKCGRKRFVLSESVWTALMTAVFRRPLPCFICVRGGCWGLLGGQNANAPIWRDGINTGGEKLKKQQLAKKRSEVQKEKKKEARERELLSRKQRQLKDKQVGRRALRLRVCTDKYKVPPPPRSLTKTTFFFKKGRLCGGSVANTTLFQCFVKKRAMIFSIMYETGAVCVFCVMRGATIN